MNLTETCPALGQWIRDVDGISPAEFDGDRGILLIDDRYRVHLQALRRHLLLRCRVATLPDGIERETMLRTLLSEATQRFEQEPFGLAVDPDGEAIWLQGTLPLTMPALLLTRTLDDFVGALDALRAQAIPLRRRHPAPRARSA